MSTPLLVFLLLALTACATTTTCREGKCSVIQKDAVRAGSVGLEK